MSDVPMGLESLDYSFPGSRPAGTFAPVLVGVVGSGNLEVMLEPRPPRTAVSRVETSARGFGAIWEAVTTRLPRNAIRWPACAFRSTTWARRRRW